MLCSALLARECPGMAEQLADYFTKNHHRHSHGLGHAILLTANNSEFIDLLELYYTCQIAGDDSEAFQRTCILLSDIPV